MNKKTLVIVFFASLISQSTIVAGGNEDINSHKNNVVNPNKSTMTDALKTGAALVIATDPNAQALAKAALLKGIQIITGTGGCTPNFYMLPIYGAYGAYKYYQSRQSPQESLKKN